MRFSKADIDVLENTNEELLNKSIDLCGKYNKVVWKKSKPGSETLPIYDKEIRYVHLIIKPKHKYKYLCKCKRPLPSPLHPIDIYCIIKDSFVRERVCVGLIAECIENKIYFQLLNELKVQLAIYKESIMKQNETIVIPSSTKFIKSECYQDNKKIKKVIFEGEDTIIGPYAFSGCDNLVEVILPSKLRSVPAGCFHNCTNLKTLYFPSTLESIGSKAFSCCGITKADLPDSVISIEEDAFNASKIKLLRAKGAKYLGTGVCEFCTNLEKVELENNQDVPSYCFARCFKLEDVKLSKEVAAIYPMAFLDCKNIKSLELPSHVVHIDKNAFVESYHPAFLFTAYRPIKNITIVVDKSERTEKILKERKIKCIVRQKSN